MGKVLKGLNLLGKAYVGNSDVKKMYVGTDKVFPPYDAEIEYLESTGTQYINTNVLSSQYLKIKCSFMRTGTAVSWGTIFGTGLSDSSSINILGRFSSSNFNPWFYNENYNELNIAIPSNEFTNVELSYGQVICNGQEYNITSTPNETSVKIFIFSANNNGPWRNQPCRISKFSIEKNENLILDMIPVRVGQIGYMYDKVSGKLFGNQGTGDFVLGNDVV